MEWEKIIANHIADHRLIPEYIKNAYNPTTKNTQITRF